MLTYGHVDLAYAHLFPLTAVSIQPSSGITTLLFKFLAICTYLCTKNYFTVRSTHLVLYLKWSQLLENLAILFKHSPCVTPFLSQVW